MNKIIPIQKYFRFKFKKKTNVIIDLNVSYKFVGNVKQYMNFYFFNIMSKLGQNK